MTRSMWQQTYAPLADSLGWSAVAAAVPLLVLLIMLGVLRKPSWLAALAALAVAAVLAIGVYHMPVGTAVSATLYGAAFGLFPITWIIFWALFLYRMTVETGRFEIIKDSIGHLTTDKRLQALLIAFGFGAFVEGAAGFGTPVAVAAAMLTGLGFSPFYAAGLCLLANTAPVAFGSIGIPVVTLAGITGLPLNELSGAVGRICAPVSLIIPAYLMMVMGGWRALSGVFPIAAACGIAFAGTQYVVSNFIGPVLTDILSSLAAIGAVVLMLKVRGPVSNPEFETKGTTSARRPTGEVVKSWLPYAYLVLCVLLWGWAPVKALLNAPTMIVPWPGLHGQVLQMPPVTAAPVNYAANFTLNWFSAAGTSCLAAALLTILTLRIPGAVIVRSLTTTASQLRKPTLTVCSVLGLAFLMNYCGATGTLGLAFSATGAAFPFFSAILGWLGVFLTGSDTSANALFGHLQVVTANRLGLDPILMAGANSSGGVMGKMISLQSIAVASAATGMAHEDESKLFRFTLKHSVFLAALIGLIVVIYSAMSRP